MRGCTLHISWIIPDNTNISEITHFMIYIDRVNIYNETNANDETFLSLSYRVRSCSPHNTSISIVNHCGREGPPSPTISTTSPEPVVCDGIVCEDNTTTGDSKFNSCLIVQVDGFLFKFSLNLFGSTVCSFVCACYSGYGPFSWSQCIFYLL